jgi:hypothetical protein
MGLQDREYMRRRADVPLRRRRIPSLGSGGGWRTWLFTLGSVIAVASAAVWLLRDARSLIPDSTPAEGSLIVNVNTATQAQLETVPGVGPSIALRIIAGRPYKSVDDLLRVSGIAEQSLETMRPFLTIDSETRPR